jgi:2-hydroxychromene-2-carboxylate isomerase
VARREGVVFRWRPFDLRTIMRELHNMPFPGGSPKTAYMWRDVERRAARYGIAWSAIPPYTIDDLAFANRIALVAAREGWCADYVRAAYRRWFLEGGDPSIEANAAVNLREVRQDPDRVLALAASDEIRTALAGETDQARALGIFGSPVFVTGGELFWGDDRLEDAIAWHRYGALKPPA